METMDGVWEGGVRWVVSTRRETGDTEMWEVRWVAGRLGVVSVAGMGMWEECSCGGMAMWSGIFVEDHQGRPTFAFFPGSSWDTGSNGVAPGDG